MSKLEHVDTVDCSANQLRNTIYRTADRVMYSENPVTILEEAMQISLDDKNQGAKVSITSVNAVYDQANYAKMVAATENAVKKRV